LRRYTAKNTDATTASPGGAQTPQARLAVATALNVAALEIDGGAAAVFEVRFGDAVWSG
jgi:hypothetical protein